MRKVTFTPAGTRDKHVLDSRRGKFFTPAEQVAEEKSRAVTRAVKRPVRAKKKSKAKRK